MPTYSSPEEAQNGLTQLLLRAVPPNGHGNLTISHLAYLLKMSRSGVHKWIDQQRLPPERVMQIVELSRVVGYDSSGEPILGEPRVERSEFDEFVFRTP